MVRAPGGRLVYGSSDQCSVMRLKAGEGAGVWITAIMVVAPLMIQLSRLPSSGLLHHLQLAASVAASCLVLMLVAPLNPRWVQRVVTPSLLWLVSLSIGLPAVVRLLVVVVDVMWTEHWSIGWHLGCAAVGAVLSLLMLCWNYDGDGYDLDGVPVFLGFSAFLFGVAGPVLMSGRAWVALVPIIVGFAAKLVPHPATHNEPFSSRSLPLISDKYISDWYNRRKTTLSASKARPTLQFAAACAAVVVGIELWSRYMK